VLDEVVAARKALVRDAVAARHGTGKFRDADAVDGGLVALQVGKTCEVCRRGAGGDVARPCPAKMISNGEAGVGCEERTWCGCCFWWESVW
jgi:hypothetical protein